MADIDIAVLTESTTVSDAVGTPFLRDQATAKRYCIQGTFQDNSGNIVPGGTVTVYLCNDDESTGALAEIFAAKFGGVAISGSYVTSDSTGLWRFFWEDTTYPLPGAEFNLLFQKAGMTDTWRRSVR